MKKLILFLFALPFIAFAQTQNEVESQLRNLAWQSGPTTGAISTHAKVAVPKGFVFLDSTNTSKFLELNGNPPRQGSYLLAPDNLNWFAVFSFEDSGYVKDDEKLDAAELLKSLQDSDEPSNEQRKKLGMKALYTDGWQVPPFYDTQSKHLEWGLRLRTDDGAKVINYTSRLLGRKGIMSAVLVSNPDKLAEDTASFKQLLGGYEYVSGEKYSEFRQGDHVAEFGLAALILGGAAAVATKKGFWAVLGGFIAAGWKLLAGLAVAAFASLGKLFKKNKPE
jgi:uncharacterized membrane-anchored protein